MFRPNVGGIDRALRLILGAIFFLGGLFLLTGAVSLGVTLAVVGLLSLLTGILRFCALYIPFGISTARPERQPLNQACDCAGWTKATQDNRTRAVPRASAEEEIEDAMATARRQGETATPALLSSMHT